MTNNIKVKIRRTAYRPDWHKKAVGLYGNSDYFAFVVGTDGKVSDFLDFNTKSKPVITGKKKGGNSDV